MPGKKGMRNKPKKMMGGGMASKKPLRMRGGGMAKKPMRCLLYTSPSPRDGLLSRMPSSA